MRTARLRGGLVFKLSLLGRSSERRGRSSERLVLLSERLVLLSERLVLLSERRGLLSERRGLLSERPGLLSGWGAFNGHPLRLVAGERTYATHGGARAAKKWFMGCVPRPDAEFAFRFDDVVRQVGLRTWGAGAARSRAILFFM
ncbi:MAG: hypothetical protein LBS82_00295 [Spirochaetaceae bacterium]|jgi:hypothetical protein|nr:hypothetical protein [Spirochaetaceae bacterium]